MTSFFAAYDALCEEGTATTVCSALDEVAVISVPGASLKLSLMIFYHSIGCWSNYSFLIKSVLAFYNITELFIRVIVINKAVLTSVFRIYWQTILATTL